MNRWLAVATVAALFLSGISIGALGVVVLHHRGHDGPAFGSPMPPPQVMIEHLEAKLHLTPEQKEKIDAILEESRKRSDEIRRDIRPRLERQIEETHERIAAVLTPEQREKFQELQSEMRRRSDRFFLGEHMHGGPHGPGGPPPPEP